MLVRKDPAEAAARLKVLFARYHFSRTEVAREVGVVPSTLSAWVTALGLDAELHAAARAGGYVLRRSPLSHREEATFVYFMQAGEGPIKIGWTSNLRRRTESAQTDNHEELRVRVSIPGGPQLEAQLHRHFAKARRRGEWFEPTPALLELIEYLEQGGSLSSYLEMADG